jgi:hypothetical protein
VASRLRLLVCGPDPAGLRAQRGAGVETRPAPSPVGVFQWDGGALTQITYNDAFDWNPEIDGTSIVWQQWDDTGAVANWEIYHYDGTLDFFEDIDPDIEGDQVVWVRSTEPFLWGGGLRQEGDLHGRSGSGSDRPGCLAAHAPTHRRPVGLARLQPGKTGRGRADES